MPALEQVRRVFWVLQLFTMELFAKILSNVNLKLLSILIKCLTVSTMCPCRWMHHSSKGDISLTESKNGIILISYFHLKFRSVNCLSISRPLKQSSKVSVQCCTQEYLFGKCSENYYWSICNSVYFLWNCILSECSSELPLMDASGIWNYYWSQILF